MTLTNFSRVLVVGAVLVLGACGDGGKSGPEEIRWDREICELCKMLISDARYVAEVRGGPSNKITKFDDVGCAVNWLNGQDWAGDPATEIWVADVSSTRANVVWLKAREAHYVKTDLTPMNYGYGAVSDLKLGIDFTQMTTKILTDTPNHICKVPLSNN